MAAWLYIMTNRPNGTLYIGVTTTITTRAWQQAGAVRGFTKKYGLTRLVYRNSRFNRRGDTSREDTEDMAPRLEGPAYHRREPKQGRSL